MARAPRQSALADRRGSSGRSGANHAGSELREPDSADVVREINDMVEKTMFEVRPMAQEDAAPVARWMAQIDPWVRYGANPERVQARLEKGIAEGDVVLTVD